MIIRLGALMEHVVITLCLVLIFDFFISDTHACKTKDRSFERIVSSH